MSCLRVLIFAVTGFIEPGMGAQIKLALTQGIWRGALSEMTNLGGAAVDLDPADFQHVAGLRDNGLMGSFMRRLITERGYQIEDEEAFKQLVPQFSGRQGQGTYKELLAILGQVTWLKAVPTTSKLSPEADAKTKLAEHEVPSASSATLADRDASPEPEPESGPSSDGPDGPSDDEPDAPSVADFKDCGEGITVGGPDYICPVKCPHDIKDPATNKAIMAWPLPDQTETFAVEVQCPEMCPDATISWKATGPMCPFTCEDRNGQLIIDNDKDYSPRYGEHKLFYVPEDARGKPRAERMAATCPDCKGEILDGSNAAKFC